MIPSMGSVFAKLRPGARVWALTALIALLGIGVSSLVDWRPLESAAVQLPWWGLAAAFFASEVFVVHYQFRWDRYTFSLMELPLTIGLFFSSLPAVVLARFVGGGLALVIHRKQGPRKLAFNLACFLLETAIDFTIFHLLAGSVDDVGPRAVVATLIAVTTGVMTVTWCITAVISVNEGRPDRQTMLRLNVANLVVSTTNVSLAVVAVLVIWVRPAAGWLLLLVAGILYVGYRSYAALQQKHDDLELLYDFTRRTGHAFQLDTAMSELLDQVRTVMRADTAAIVVETAAHGSLLLTQLDGDEGLKVRTTDRTELWARVAGSTSALLAPKPLRDGNLADQLALHEVRDALVAPLRGNDGGATGYLLAGNRRGDQRTFSTDDLKIFEALANHAAVSLENRSLVDRLRSEVADKAHQAMHDALTKLPNRTLFHERVQKSLQGDRGGDRKVAVMLLDLDRFKDVNDTLGHHYGDLLLQEIAVRLGRTLRAGDTVARLGGDEFAVMLPDVPGAEAATAVADMIRQALRRPFDIGDVTLDVGASVGIAIWPDHGDDPSTLLQRADVAMYDAKSRQAGVAVYNAAADTHSLDRLALVGELRQAIDLGELAVHYQPKARLDTGVVVGAEALVRWQHPRQGAIPPEEIVRMAEQTGLIRPLTLWVLRQALHECRRWRRSGHDFDVAVNLSSRSLSDATLVADVQGLLDEVGLPASALTLEITESSMMLDRERSLGVLARLRAAGISLAIDDFGTGYSSFSHLQHLPVDEIKIDRSFVTNMADDSNGVVIVHAIADLSRHLHLRVVAEGVEDEASWNRLRDAGCDLAQGYLLTRPLPSVQFAEWLEVTGGVFQPVPVTAPQLLPAR